MIRQVANTSVNIVLARIWHPLILLSILVHFRFTSRPILLSFVLLRNILGKKIERLPTFNTLLDITMLIDIFFKIECEEYDKEYGISLAVLERVS